MKKRLFNIFITLCMALSFVSCGSSDNSDASSETAATTTVSETDVTTVSSDVVTSTTTKQTTTAATVSENEKSVTSSKKAVTSSSTSATTTTKAAVTTQKSSSTAKATQPAAHQHTWVKQWDDGDGTIFYWCPLCYSEKYEHYTPKATTTTTTTSAKPKSTHQHNWQPIYKTEFTGHYRCHCGLLTDTPIYGNGANHDKAFAEEDAHQKVDVEYIGGGLTVSAGYDNSGSCGHKSDIVSFYYCTKCNSMCYPDADDADQEGGKIAHPSSDIFERTPDWWGLNVEYYWFKETPFEKSVSYIDPMYNARRRYVKHKGEWVLIYVDSFFADTKN